MIAIIAKDWNIASEKEKVYLTNYKKDKSVRPKA